MPGTPTPTSAAEPPADPHVPASRRHRNRPALPGRSARLRHLDRSREKADRKGFFLGGRNFSWLLIGTSLFATNISSVQFVGQSGLAYKIGIAAANPQLTGVICLAVSAVFFIPICLRTRIFTIPGILESRYGWPA